MRFDIVTLFPAIFDGYLRQGLLDKAIQARIGSNPSCMTCAIGHPTRLTDRSTTNRSEVAPGC